MLKRVSTHGGPVYVNEYLKLLSYWSNTPGTSIYCEDCISHPGIDLTDPDCETIVIISFSSSNTM